LRPWSVEPIPAGSPAERLWVALDLYAAGEDMMRQNLRRRHPRASEAEIAERLTAWLRTRPGAEHGDGAGKPVAWPRRVR